MAKYKNVTGSVQEKNGSWHAVLNYTDLETGKRKNKWKKIGRVSIKRGDGGLTEKQAKESLPKIIVELEDELSRKKEEFAVYDGMSDVERRIYKEQNTDFYEYAGKFLEQKKGVLHLATYISYESQLNSRIKKFFYNNYKLKDISYFLLEEFFKKFDEDGLKRTTKTRYKAFVKLVLDDAVTKGLIPSNPIYQFPKGTFGQSNFKAQTFKITEIQELLSKLETSDDIIAKLVIIASHLALRREEILGFKKTLTYDDGQTVYELRVPTVKEFIDESTSMIAKMERLLNGEHSIQSDIVSNQLTYHLYKMLTPWIKTLSLYDEKGNLQYQIPDREAIYDSLDVDQLEDSTLYEDTSDFIRDTKISFYSSTTLKCPKCGKLADLKHDNMFPLDMQYLFFCLSCHMLEQTGASY